MANPTALFWTNPQTNVDGSPFTAAQYAGFEAEITGPTGKTLVAIPATWSVNGEYGLPLKDLGVGFGTSYIRMATLAVGGERSDWTNPLAVTIGAPPLPPQNLRVG